MSLPPPTEAGPKPAPREPWETAMATAMMRALAAHDEREEIRCRDGLAEVFLAPEGRRLLVDRASREAALKYKTAPGMYEFMIARTAFFDEVVERVLREDIPQLVFLGAGYDTRPYRFRTLIKGTRIFELDLAPTQQRKQALLREAGVAIPDQLTFVAVDFRRDNFGDVLRAAGYDAGRAALFVWEGVTYYLAADVVDDMLGGVRAIAPAGGSICFDYASLSLEALGEEGVKKLREKMKTDHPGEPAKFGIRAGELESFLAARGFTVVEHLAPEEMEARYLTLRDGSRAGKLPQLFHLVLARVAG
jgi:methyltransferase (TIGR00027 family)